MKTETLDIKNCDCRELLATLDDNSIDAIVTDPPYYRCVDHDWDRQWKSKKDYLNWLDTLAAEWARVLKPAGSLYCFASPPMAAAVEVQLSDRFNILNHIVWQKNSGTWQKSKKSALRSFFPQTERLIFAEHYGADNSAKGEDGYGAKSDQLRGFIFEPLRAYLCDEFDRAGMLNTQGKKTASIACGFTPSAKGMIGHYFSQSQWALPTKKHYHSLRDLLNKSGGDYLRQDYEDLRREYEDLRREYEDRRREYEDRRRPFFGTDHHYTDLWKFDVYFGTDRTHPCQKPAGLMEHIIKTSTRPGDLVLDCFIGSGSTARACHTLGRRCIGSELDPQYYTDACAMLRNAHQLHLFPGRS